MGSGDVFHVHHVKQKEDLRSIPKGCLAIMVGQGEEEQQRFVIPVIYINHPLFLQLLKDAEEEYGFKHDGPINIPCHVEQFRHIQGIIDKDTSHNHHHHHHGHAHHHHHHHHSWCFKIRA